MRLAMTCAVGVLLTGCFGFDEKIEACRRGEGVCFDAGRLTGCEPMADNLLSNGSFERTTADGGLAGFVAEPPLVQRDGGASACLFWAEQTATTSDQYVDAPFDLSPAPPAGTRFELGANVRTLDGNADPVVFHLRVRSGGYRVGMSGRLNNDGSWTPVSVQLPLSEESSTLEMTILSSVPRSLGFDQLYVRRIP